MYRYKRGIPLDYNTQGYIYFVSLMYGSLSIGERRRIDRLCKSAGGEYEDALFEFVTTSIGYDRCCREHYISQAQLYRIVRKYYMLFKGEIDCGLW